MKSTNFDKNYRNGALDTNHHTLKILNQVLEGYVHVVNRQDFEINKLRKELKELETKMAHWIQIRHLWRRIQAQGGQRV